MEGIEIEVPDREEAACALDTVEARLVRQGQYDAACDVINAKRRIRLDEEELADRNAEIERLKKREEDYCRKRCFGHEESDVANWVTEAAYQKLEAEIERLRAKLDSEANHRLSLCADNERFVAELERLRRDKARLDWMEAVFHSPLGYDDASCIRGVLRWMIDAAMSGEDTE